MSRRRPKLPHPRNTEYKAAAAFAVNTESGRADLWHQRLIRAREMLELDQRRDHRKMVLPFIDGSYRDDPNGDHVYLNEALPALEDVVFGTLPELPPVDVEARQMEQEDLADAMAALTDATLDSGISRAYSRMIDAEWDEISWGIGILHTKWLEKTTRENYRATGDPDYLRPHIITAMRENQDPQNAVLAGTDDHAIHIQLHAGVPGLETHVSDHWARFGLLSWAHPIVRRVDPDCFLYDPDAKDWEDRDWEAELVDEKVIDLQDIPGIKNLTPENCPTIDEFGRYETDPKRIEASFDFEKTRVLVWQIHDRANDSYTILPFQQKDGVKPIFEDSWPYGSLDTYYAVVHRPIAGQIHGQVTLQLIAPIIEELARTNADIRRHNRNASKAKPITVRGALDQQAFNELNDDKKWIATLPNAESLAMLKDWKPPSTPRELLDHRDLLLAELRRLLGSEAMSQGAANPHKITASEAQLRGGYLQDRLKRRKEGVSKVLAWLSTNILLLYRQFADGPLMVRVMGPQGLVVKQLDPAAIPEDIAVRLDIEAVSEARKSEGAQREQQWIKMVTSIMPPGMYNPLRLLMDYGKALGKRNPERIFIGPEEQAMTTGPGPNMGSQPGQGNVIPFPGAQGGPAPAVPQLAPRPMATQTA